MAKKDFITLKATLKAHKLLRQVAAMRDERLFQTLERLLETEWRQLTQKGGFHEQTDTKSTPR